MHEGRKLLAILLDPDKIDPTGMDETIKKLNSSMADLIFVGGSSVEKKMTDSLVEKLKGLTSLPIVIFPGDYEQISSHADAVLFLSLISGRNPEYLINQQVKAVPYLQKSELEVIPTGYILIDGGKETAVQRVSDTVPIAAEHIEKITHTAVAGMYMGNKLIYLEAGSGALNPVNSDVIQAVRNSVDVPIIVGGGIRSAKELFEAYKNGADVAVIGTAFEDNNDFFTKIMKNEHIH